MKDERSIIAISYQPSAISYQLSAGKGVSDLRFTVKFEPHSSRPLAARAWLRYHRRPICFVFSWLSGSLSVAGRHVFQEPRQLVRRTCFPTTLGLEPMLP